MSEENCFDVYLNLPPAPTLPPEPVRAGLALHGCSLTVRQKGTPLNGIRMI